MVSTFALPPTTVDNLSLCPDNLGPLAENNVTLQSQIVTMSFIFAACTS
jgi:hypothetical protein